jgi:hypothetical protein
LLHPFNLLHRFRRLNMSRSGLKRSGHAKVMARPSEQLTPTTKTAGLLVRNTPYITWTANVTLGWLIF